MHLFPLSVVKALILEIVTWDTTFFAGDRQDSEIRVAVRWTPSNVTVASFNVRAGNGYVPMPVTGAFMRGTGKNDKALHMVMFYTEESGEPKETEGPTIYATTEEISVVDVVKRPGRKGVHPAAIAVPVVVAVLALGVGFFCLWRKNKDKLVLSRIRRRSSQGYGVSKSRTQRGAAPEDGAVGTKNSDIRLQESPVSPRSEGRNVFQEELRRQETGGRF